MNLVALACWLTTNARHSSVASHRTLAHPRHVMPPQRSCVLCDDHTLRLRSGDLANRPFNLTPTVTPLRWNFMN